MRSDVTTQKTVNDKRWTLSYKTSRAKINWSSRAKILDLLAQKSFNLLPQKSFDFCAKIVVTITFSSTSTYLPNSKNKTKNLCWTLDTVTEIPSFSNLPRCVSLKIINKQYFIRCRARWRQKPFFSYLLNNIN